MALDFLVLLASWWVSKQVRYTVDHLVTPRIESPLLCQVFTQSSGHFVFLLGLYFVLHVAGLTRLAATVVGGTGLMGLIIGIAFRDIT